MYKLLALCFIVAGLSSCGKSENEIRMEERLKYTEERLTEAENRGRLQTEKSDESAAPPMGETATTPAAKNETTSETNSQLSQSKTRTRASSRRIGSYSAYIGSSDLHNSNGKRLTQPWAILRQDRANFHRFGVRQRGDSSDSFFANARNREVMEKMVRAGSMSARARQLIVSGGAAVKVDIYGAGDRGDYLDITVY